MTSINTGPTATAMHHMLAWSYSVTGIEPLWLFAFFLVGAFAVFCLIGWAVERSQMRRSGRPRAAATRIWP